MDFEEKTKRRKAREKFSNSKYYLLRPKSCEICKDCPKRYPKGNERIHSHHEDYDEPFKIIWVCTSCHKKIHSGKIKLNKKLIVDIRKEFDSIPWESVK